MWWAGLRGAIAVGLVVGIPTSLRYMMLATTVVIVLLTVFVMGGTTAFMLKKLGVRMGDQAPEINSKPSDRLLKVSVKLQKILCNYDEDGDGIDDRYQSIEYIRRSSTSDVTAPMRESKSESGTVTVTHEKRQVWNRKITMKDSIKTWQPVDENDEQNRNLKQLSNMKNWDGDIAAPDELEDSEGSPSRTKVVPVEGTTSGTS